MISKITSYRHFRYIFRFRCEKVTLEYILWENINDSDLDSLEIIQEQDSLLQTAIDFASEAEITSFHEALKLYELNVTDTIQVTEDFKNNLNAFKLLNMIE